MEGDAGASRLNPADTDDSSSDSAVGAAQTSTEIAAEGLVETDAEDVSEAGVDLGTETANDERNPSRVGRRWVIGLTAALLVLAGGVGAGGYLALRWHQDSQAIARHDAEAVEAAKDCVAATQAPDISAMVASEQKIIDCATGDFRTQAVFYSSLFVEAYQAANAHVQVSDMRAAAERNNDDGSVDVLVALRVKVSNSEAQNREAGYRLRVKMTLDEGQYKISKLDQVAK